MVEPEGTIVGSDSEVAYVVVRGSPLTVTVAVTVTNCVDCVAADVEVEKAEEEAVAFDPVAIAAC